MDGSDPISAADLRLSDINRICWAALAAAPGPFTFTQADVFLADRAREIPGNAVHTVYARAAVYYLGGSLPVQEIPMAQIQHILVRKQANYSRMYAAFTIQQNNAAHANGKH